MANLAKYALGAIGGANGYGTASTGAGFSSGDIAFFNSLANGSCVVGSTAVANGTNLDLYGRVAVSIKHSATSVAGGNLLIYLLPLNGDGTTYGDGTPSGAAQATVPGPGYYKGVISTRPGIAAGTALTGTSERFMLPEVDFKLVLVNNMGAALGSAAAVSVWFKSSTENLNG